VQASQFFPTVIIRSIVTILYQTKITPKSKQNQQHLKEGKSTDTSKRINDCKAYRGQRHHDITFPSAKKDMLNWNLTHCSPHFQRVRG